MARPTMQFTLGTLFILVTGSGIFFAYPAFCIGCLFLMAGSLAVLAVFIVGFFLPVYLLSNWLTGKPKQDQEK